MTFLWIWLSFLQQKKNWEKKKEGRRKSQIVTNTYFCRFDVMIIMTVCKSNSETEMFLFLRCIFTIYNSQFTNFNLNERKIVSAFGFIQSRSLAPNISNGFGWLQQNCITTVQQTTKQLSYKIIKIPICASGIHLLCSFTHVCVYSTEHFYIAADTFLSIPCHIFL